MSPIVAQAIDESWVLVKRPATVTFVVDTSASMLGPKLRRAKEGLKLAMESIADNNQVGLITFGDRVEQRIPIAPIESNRDLLHRSIDAMKAVVRRRSMTLSKKAFR